MNIKELKKELKLNNINQKSYSIFSDVYFEGVLYLNKYKEVWKVTLNERGIFYIDEIFDTEHEACMYFLKKILSDPTYRNDFDGKNIAKYFKESIELLKKYNF